MNVNYTNTKENTNNLFIAESDGLTLDYDEIKAGIIRARNDIKHGRYMDSKTFLENIKRKFCNE